MSNHPNYAICTIIYAVAHFVGIAALVLVGLWINHDKQGFGFHERADLEFKFHPILMSLSLLFLNGEAIMIYRGLRFWPKWLTKFIHFTLHTVSFVFMAVWDSHDYNKAKDGTPSPMPNAMRAHAWVGLATASLYGVQFAGGLTTFYLPISPLHIRKAMMPFHRAMGLIIFSFSLGAVLMGNGEKGAFLPGCPDANVICERDLFSNLFCLCVLGYGACVFLIAAIPEWIRVPLPDEIPGGATIAVKSYESQETNTNNNVTGAWSTQGTYRQTEETFKTSL